MFLLGFCSLLFVIWPFMEYLSTEARDIRSYNRCTIWGSSKTVLNISTYICFTADVFLFYFQFYKSSTSRLRQKKHPSWGSHTSPPWIWTWIATWDEKARFFDVFWGQASQNLKARCWSIQRFEEFWRSQNLKVPKFEDFAVSRCWCEIAVGSIYQGEEPEKADEARPTSPQSLSCNYWHHCVVSVVLCCVSICFSSEKGRITFNDWSKLWSMMAWAR